MTRADRLYSRPPLSTPIADDPIHAAIDTYRTPLREYLFEGAAVVFILISAGIASCLIASNLESKIAHHCTVDLAKVTQ